MNNEDIIGIIIITCVMLFIITFITFLSIITPIRERNAQIECENKGFETFVEYNTLVFQTKLSKCICGSMEDRMIYEGKIKAYMTNGDKIIVQETTT